MSCQWKLVGSLVYNRVAKDCNLGVVPRAGSIDPKRGSLATWIAIFGVLTKQIGKKRGKKSKTKSKTYNPTPTVLSAVGYGVPRAR